PLNSLYRCWRPVVRPDDPLFLPSKNHVTFIYLRSSLFLTILSLSIHSIKHFNQSYELLVRNALA
ncbi:hypothetical protein ACPEGK_24805, partial [Klebsiella sp. K794]|uniref:hypothetical protein n=1 Tax=Klebsiella sp. K794 TaxID=3369402 RepID=UPI003C30A906